ncbi:MAG: hypothetical protein AB9836_06295 [Aminipila sp.]
MENFFKKKQIFAILFCVLLVGLSIYIVGKNYGLFTSIDLKYKALTVYGNIEKILGKKESKNLNYVKDEKGYIYYSASYIQPDENVLDYATRVRRLKEFVEKKGTKCMVVSFPQKNWQKTEAGMGLHIANYNYIQDEFLFYLMYGRVDSLDLRNAFNKMQAEKKRLYYKTDSSLTTYGSFMAFTAMLEELEHRYNFKLDPDKYYRNLENYKITEYKKCFLGNLGDDTGLGFAELEDFQLYMLQDQHRYKWEHLSKENSRYTKEGIGAKTLFNTTALNAENVYNADFMDTFMDLDDALDVVKNADNKEGLKVLCIRDENFAPLGIFLAPMCSELHLISADTSLVDIEDYVRDNDFDLVLVGISSKNIKAESFKYGKTKDSFK